ncbi:MAG: glycosyltransferase 87 family protein, partial [Candidatus Rokuibacteriota bacterium]
MRPGRGVLALVCGGLVLGLVGAAVAFAFPEASPLVPEHEGGDSTWAWLYLAAAVAAFAAYLAGLLVLSRPEAPRRLRAVVVVACAVQLLPLAGPVLLSTDLYTYWDYARIAVVHDGNPYEDVPSDFPEDPAFPLMGSYWHDTTSVYGPGFTLASEAHAAAVGESEEAAALVYKALAALAMVALVLLAARLSPRPALAAAFVGWNPLLALHFAGGGHNDAWMMALVLAALALAASGRRALAGVAWALAIAVKWVPLLFLPLRLLEARRVGRRIDHRGLGIAAAAIVAIATWRYGLSWLG